MKLGETGEAFFVEEVEDDENDIPDHLATSPIPVPEFENMYKSQVIILFLINWTTETSMNRTVNNVTRQFKCPVNFQGRRRSLDLEDISPILNLENQENDYTKRRNTADNDNAKTRERNFIKRQIILGNIEVGETSAEDMTLSMISGKLSSEDLSKSINDISETIFKMDSLDIETSKVTYIVNMFPHFFELFNQKFFF